MSSEAFDGTTVARTAAEAPARPAVLGPDGDRTFGELAARCNQLSRALGDAGLRAGDAVALLCGNRPEWIEALYACEQSGLRLTPINWHLGPDEIAYIVGDCEAKAVVADARFGEGARAAADVAGVEEVLAVGGPIDGFDLYDDFIEEQSSEPLAETVRGIPMLYTSGTTGRPKGVHRDMSPGSVETAAKLAGYRGGEDLALVTGPLYHAAPLVLNLQAPFAGGCGVVLMDGWDAEEFLRLVSEHGVTHTHMVPTMFHRLLALPDEVRERYDVASLRYVLHGAAPCPVHVKRAMIDWLGPIIHEYYAATEGGGTAIAASDWLEHPGSVGKPLANPVEVRDDAGTVCSPGDVGTVWFKRPEVGAFRYFKADDKTARTYDEGSEWFTLGDHGYFDDDGYLYLTGRDAEVIISGGVNIYPAEVDAVILMHDAVADALCVGVPDDEWGEQVKAVVELKDDAEPSESLAAELLAHCRDRLAAYKCPRSVDFVDELPRSDAGKALRTKVRQAYWETRR